ncbi:MAG: glycosyltransferase, partial [Vampirovibrionales bacterium]
MTLQEHAYSLQLILITYNRANHVERTFQQLLAEGSPVRNLPLLVLDNNSTDATADV